MASKDVLLDSDNDLQGSNGDFAYALDADQQHIDLILQSAKGDWKQHPALGPNIQEFLKAPFTMQVRNELQRRIKLNLESDNFKIRKLEVNNLQDIQVNAERTQ